MNIKNKYLCAPLIQIRAMKKKKQSSLEIKKIKL